MRQSRKDVMEYRYMVYCGKIERVELIHETDRSLVIREDRPDDAPHRMSKNSRHASFFTTWDEAHKELISQAERDVKASQEHLTWATKRLAAFKDMQKPEGWA